MKSPVNSFAENPLADGHPSHPSGSSPKLRGPAPSNRRPWSSVLLALAAILGAWPRAQAAPEDIAKYADPGVQVAQLMEGGGAVIVSSLNILVNGDLFTIAFVSRDQAASVGVTVAGKLAVIGRISKDQGRSWGPAFRVVDSPADGSRTAVDPTTVVAGGKILVLAPMSGPPQPPFDYGDLKVWKVESNDNGATWSLPVEIPIPRARPCVSGRPGITLGDGTILVPYWWDFMFQTGANGMAVIGDIPCVSGTLISRDAGSTWQLSTDVYGEWSVQPKVLRPADEPAIVAVSDRDVFMVLRSARADGRAEETWSHDGGRTWESPRPGPLHAFNTPSALWRLKNGWVARLWNDSQNATRYPLVIAFSQDQCRTWSRPRTIVGFPAGSKWPVQASYPGVVETADGSLVAVWCHVTPEGKWLWASGRFSRDWALGNAAAPAPRR
jgi:hypothetical protein